MTLIADVVSPVAEANVSAPLPHSVVETVVSAPLLRPAALQRGDTIGIVAPSYSPREGWLTRLAVLGNEGS